MVLFWTMYGQWLKSRDLQGEFAVSVERPVSARQMLKRSSQPPLATGVIWRWTGAAFGAGTLTRAARAKPATSETANRRLVGGIKPGLASAAKTCLWPARGKQRTARLPACAKRGRGAA